MLHFDPDNLTDCAAMCFLSAGGPGTSWSWGGAWSLWELPGSPWDGRGEEHVNDVLVNEETCHSVKGKRREVGIRGACLWSLLLGGGGRGISS